MNSLSRLALTVALSLAVALTASAAKKIKITGTLHEPVTMHVGNGARTEIINSLPYVFEVEKSELPMNLTFESPHYVYYEIQVPKKPFDDSGHIYLMKIDETAMAMRMNNPTNEDTQLGKQTKTMAQQMRELQNEMSKPVEIYYVDAQGELKTLTSPAPISQGGDDGGLISSTISSVFGGGAKKFKYELRNYGAILPRQNQGFYIKVSNIGVLGGLTLTPFEFKDNCRQFKAKTGKSIKFDTRLDMQHEQIAPGIYHLNLPILASGDYAIVQHLNGQVVAVMEFSIDGAMPAQTKALAVNKVTSILNADADEQPETPMLAQENTANKSRTQKAANTQSAKQKTRPAATAPVEAEEIPVPETPSSDIDINIPSSGIVAENTFALVIANEDYTRVAPVPYAKNDGRVFKQYLHKTFGLDEKSVIYLENATFNDMKFALNRISEICNAFSGDASLIVYYSGHGIPNESTGEGYLLPVDGYGTDPSTALSISDLYKTISNLPIKKATMFMDACFSGAKRDGSMLVAARGVAIKAKAEAPKGKLLVLSAATDDQTAYPYEEKKHGLMTYFLLKKIQATKGKIKAGELFNFVETSVKRTSIVENGKLQTPVSAVSPLLSKNWKDMQLW